MSLLPLCIREWLTTVRKTTHKNMEKWYRGSRIHMAFQYLKQLYSLQEKCRLKLLKVGNWTPPWAVIFHLPHWQKLGSLITQHTTLARLCRNRLSKTLLVEVWIATPPLEGHLAPLIKLQKHMPIDIWNNSTWHRGIPLASWERESFTGEFITSLFTLDYSSQTCLHLWIIRNDLDAQQ